MAERALESMMSTLGQVICFFFSSRRRHTRSLCDWSSDVCSSDLKEQLAKVWDEHTRSGTHQSKREPFPNWVSSEVMKEAAALCVAEAEKILSPLLALGRSYEKDVRRSALRSSGRAANF